MKLRIILFSGIILFGAACNQNQKKQSDVKQAENMLTVDEFFSNADSYSDNAITLKGTVTHVCRHGGQRMFIIGSDPDNRLKITPGSSISEFGIELEGRELQISGILDEERIDENYLDTWEKEVLEKQNEEHGEDVGIHDGDHTENVRQEMEKIDKYRKQIEASGKGYISFYSLVCDSFKEL
jgi:hypothetical protein